MNSIESELRKLFPTYKPLSTYRGSTAMYLTARLIQKTRGSGHIILPSTVCPSVPLAIYHAGLKPRFCDVKLETFCVDEDKMEELINKETRGILFVHLFGKVAFSKATLQMVKKNEIPIIEDIAQALGGSLDGELLGAFGDFTILSFNRVKIVGGQSGALLVKNEHDWRKIKDLHRNLPLPLDFKAQQRLAQKYNDEIKSFFKLARLKSLNIAPYNFQNRANDLIRLFFSRFQEIDGETRRTVCDLKNLKSIKKNRYDKAQLYMKSLPPRFKGVSFTEDEMCWRLPGILSEGYPQQNLVHKIRQNKLLISDHYFPSSLLFEGGSYPMAEEIGKRALNFFVSEDISISHIKECCYNLGELLDA